MYYKQIIRGLNIKPEIGFIGYSAVTFIKDGTENILVDTGSHGVRSYLAKFIEKNSIDKVFISHLHFDHCANISLFKNIPIYINRHEMESLEKKENTFSDINNFIKKAINDSTVIFFSAEEYLSENTHIKLTPGHTVGHSSLEIINQAKKIIVAGDAIETHQEYLNLNYKIECFDEAQYKKSYDLIKDYYDIIIPGHDSIIEDGKKQELRVSFKSF